MHLLFLDESGRIDRDGMFALGGIAVRDTDWSQLRERGVGIARGYLKRILLRFAVHPATGELEGVGLKQFPDVVPRERGANRLF